MELPVRFRGLGVFVNEGNLDTGIPPPLSKAPWSLCLILLVCHWDVLVRREVTHLPASFRTLGLAELVRIQEFLNSCVDLLIEKSAEEGAQ